MNEQTMQAYCRICEELTPHTKESMRFDCCVDCAVQCLQISESKRAEWIGKHFVIDGGKIRFDAVKP
jgi:hypothetical protein